MTEVRQRAPVACLDDLNQTNKASQISNSFQHRMYIPSSFENYTIPSPGQIDDIGVSPKPREGESSLQLLPGSLKSSRSSQKSVSSLRPPQQSLSCLWHECQDLFPTRGALDAHVMLHTKENCLVNGRAVFKCPHQDCVEVCHSMTARDLHIKAIHTPLAALFPCRWVGCMKRFLLSD